MTYSTPEKLGRGLLTSQQTMACREAYWRRGLDLRDSTNNRDLMQSRSAKVADWLLQALFGGQGLQHEL